MFSFKRETELVLPLAEMNQANADVSLVGSKVANLVHMLEAGFKVPEGFVLTTAAFELFLAANNLSATSSLEMVKKAAMPPQVNLVLQQALASFEKATPLAVRSSAVAEDLAEASYAGQYATVLNVHGFEKLVEAIKTCWASAFSLHLKLYQKKYGHEFSPVAVLVQRFVMASAAGVAFTVNPDTGNRNETIINAVQGSGEQLLSGQATPDVWCISDEDEKVVYSINNKKALDATQALAVARLARRIERYFDAPQDVEWAIADNEELYLLQARPVTAFPEVTQWEAPMPGGWARNFRLGEWLPDPVTPLFESWLLERLEKGIELGHRKVAGIPIKPPLHVVIHGWYYFTLNIFPDQPVEWLKVGLRYTLPVFLSHPKRLFLQLVMLKTSYFGVEPFVQDWREKWWPRYKAVVTTGEKQVEHLSAEELVNLINQVAAAAANYFWSIIMVGGFGWKAERPLAEFYRSHLYPYLGGSHQQLLTGLYLPPANTQNHTVYSLDWVQPTLGEIRQSLAPNLDLTRQHAELETKRLAAEEQARTILAPQPKLLKQFDRLLMIAQRYVPIREAQLANFTFGWPLMRRAALLLGKELCRYNVIEDSTDIFFLTRAELEAELENGLAVGSKAENKTVTVATRRKKWQQQRRLSPPLVVGQVPKMLQPMFGSLDSFRSINPAIKGKEILRGLPASPGQATGRVRVIHGLADFEVLEAGEVLVLAALTPAWTPLFNRAIAVVSDIGSPIAHASLIAREYGIPAVVGTVEATRQLYNGQVVTVDGNAGVILAVD